MTSRFPRKVVGFPTYAYVYGASEIPNNDVLACTLAGGPGEVLGWVLLRYAAPTSALDLLNYKVVVDGVTIYDSYLSWYLGMPLDKTGHSLHSTCDIESSAITTVSHRLKFAFESTCSLTWKNQSGASINLGAGVHYRYGA
jgi:hypothetical protein